MGDLTDEQVLHLTSFIDNVFGTFPGLYKGLTPCRREAVLALYEEARERDMLPPEASNGPLLKKPHRITVNGVQHVTQKEVLDYADILAFAELPLGGKYEITYRSRWNLQARAISGFGELVRVGEALVINVREIVGA
jgi:hypothetical protein